MRSWSSLGRKPPSDSIHAAHSGLMPIHSVGPCMREARIARSEEHGFLHALPPRLIPLSALSPSILFLIVCSFLADSPDHRCWRQRGCQELGGTFGQQDILAFRFGRFAFRPTLHLSGNLSLVVVSSSMHSVTSNEHESWFLVMRDEGIREEWVVYDLKRDSLFSRASPPFSTSTAIW